MQILARVIALKVDFPAFVKFHCIFKLSILLITRSCFALGVEDGGS